VLPAAAGDVTTVFEDRGLSMRRGDFTCIIGHSGCGKTTVLISWLASMCPRKEPHCPITGDRRAEPSIAR